MLKLGALTFGGPLTALSEGEDSGLWEVPADGDSRTFGMAKDRGSAGGEPSLLSASAVTADMDGELSARN